MVYVGVTTVLLSCKLTIPRVQLASTRVRDCQCARVLVNPHATTLNYSLEYTRKHSARDSVSRVLWTKEQTRWTNYKPLNNAAIIDRDEEQSSAPPREGLLCSRDCWEAAGRTHFRKSGHLVQAAEKVQGKRKRGRPCKAATTSEARSRASCFYRQRHGSKRRAFVATTTTAFGGTMAGAASVSPDSAQSPTEPWMGVHKTKILSACSRNQQDEASRMVQRYDQP